jgi:DinB superfamily
MTIDRSYVEANRTQLERMRELVERATDEDLATTMPDGWTVAAVLGHLAFWDQRVLVVLDMEERGVTVPPYDDAEVDWINDTAKRFLLAMQPRAAALLALQIAEEADLRVAELSDERIRRAAETWFNPFRSEDRQEHLDEIEHQLTSRERGGST